MPSETSPTSSPEAEHYPTQIIWSAPATTPPLSEEEIKDIRQTLHLLQDLLQDSTSSSNEHNDDNDDDDVQPQELFQVANNITNGATAAPPIRKRDKAKRFLKAHSPRIVGAAIAVGLGVLNVVTSIS